MSRIRTGHRWCGLLVGAFLVFQGITGAISQQRFALLAMSEPQIYAVSAVMPTSLSPAEIIASVKATKPDFRPAHVMLPMDNNPNTAAIVMGGRKAQGIDMSRSVTVDQYSGMVIAERASSDGWVGTVTGWHKWANYGSSGRIFVTVFGVLTIGFILSGLLLWAKTRRYAARQNALWRLHRGVGIVLGAVLSVVSLTGVWMNLATWKERVDGQSVVGANMRAGMRQSAANVPQLSLANAWQAASAQYPDHRLAAFSDIGPHAAQYWFAFTDAQLRRIDVLINPADGEITHYPLGLLTQGDGVRSWLYSVHTGYVFGQWGGIIMTLLGALVLFWPISGFLMWRSRTRTRLT